MQTILRTPYLKFRVSVSHLSVAPFELLERPTWVKSKIKESFESLMSLPLWLFSLENRQLMVDLVNVDLPLMGMD